MENSCCYSNVPLGLHSDPKVISLIEVLLYTFLAPPTNPTHQSGGDSSSDSSMSEELSVETPLLDVPSGRSTLAPPTVVTAPPTKPKPATDIREFDAFFGEDNVDVPVEAEIAATLVNEP